MGTITLNRPERVNAFTLEMIDAWAAILAAARTDPHLEPVLGKPGQQLGRWQVGDDPPIADHRDPAGQFSLGAGLMIRGLEAACPRHHH